LSFLSDVCLKHNKKKKRLVLRKSHLISSHFLISRRISSRRALRICRLDARRDAPTPYLSYAYTGRLQGLGQLIRKKMRLRRSSISNHSNWSNHSYWQQTPNMTVTVSERGQRRYRIDQKGDIRNTVLRVELG